MRLTRSFACPCAAADYRDEIEAKGFTDAVILLTDDGASIVSVRAPATHDGLIAVGGAIVSAVALLIGVTGILAAWVVTP